MGRPREARNFGGRSHLSREFKLKGFNWVHELIDSYIVYKDQVKAGGTPDPSLLYFWQEVLPYISLKMNEKETRRTRMVLKRKPRNGVSDSALEALAKAEGRAV